MSGYRLLTHFPHSILKQTKLVHLILTFMNILSTGKAKWKLKFGDSNKKIISGRITNLSHEKVSAEISCCTIVIYYFGK